MTISWLMLENGHHRSHRSVSPGRILLAAHINVMARKQLIMRATLTLIQPPQSTEQDNDFCNRKSDFNWCSNVILNAVAAGCSMRAYSSMTRPSGPDHIISVNHRRRTGENAHSLDIIACHSSRRDLTGVWQPSGLPKTRSAYLITADSCVILPDWQTPTCPLGSCFSLLLQTAATWLKLRLITRWHDNEDWLLSLNNAAFPDDGDAYFCRL